MAKEASNPQKPRTYVFRYMKSIPAKWMISLRKMHYAKYGLMERIFEVEDQTRIKRIVVTVVDCKPVAWYCVFVTHRVSKDTVWDAMFWVKTRERGKGYGKALVDHFFRYAKKSKATQFQVYDDIWTYTQRHYNGENIEAAW